MIKLVKLIGESKQVGKVYHFTTLDALIRILISDRLRSTDMSRLNIQTVSTTRNKNFFKQRERGGDFRKPFSGNAVALELDGNKISSIYQTKSHRDASTEKEKEIWGNEQEQIWYGKQIEKDVGIKNISKYITKILFRRKVVEGIIFRNFLPHEFERWIPRPELKQYLNSTNENKMNVFMEYVQTLTNVSIEWE